jgi:hypothetical protein
MVRCSIREYLQPFITQIGSEIGTDDPTEIITFILNDYKRGLKRQPLPVTQGSSDETADEELLALLDS